MMKKEINLKMIFIRLYSLFFFIFFLIGILGIYGINTLQMRKISISETNISYRESYYSINNDPLIYNDHDYVLYTYPKTWSEAQLDCESRGGYLVTITSQEENDFISSLIGEDGIWIGFTDETNEGDWQWVTGEPVIYTSWSSDEPNDAGEGEDYAEMFSSGEWNDNGGPADPTLEHYYVCEWDDSILINGNPDFLSQATSEGWSGDGSELNPLIIDGLVLSNSGVLISIKNTDLHFQIEIVS